jgi:hypothetical protein
MGRRISVLAVAIVLLGGLSLVLGGCGGEQGTTSAKDGSRTAATTSAVTSSEATTSAASKTTAQSGHPPTLPNTTLYPGATNPDVTQSNISSTICTSGFTKPIRPPTSYTNKLKQQQLTDEKLPGKLADYEEDHLISLELGGAPQDPRNLWPEPWESRGSKLASAGTGAESKDKVENQTNKLVCSGKMTLSDAQQRISADWQKLGKDEGVL